MFCSDHYYNPPSFLQCAIVIKHKFACEITLRGRKMLLKERKNYKLLFEVD